MFLMALQEVWFMIFFYPYLILSPVFLLLPPLLFLLSFKKPTATKKWLRWMTPLYVILFLPCFGLFLTHAAFFTAYLLLVPWCFAWCVGAVSIRRAVMKRR